MGVALRGFPLCDDGYLFCLKAQQRDWQGPPLDTSWRRLSVWQCVPYCACYVQIMHCCPLISPPSYYGCSQPLRFRVCRVMGVGHHSGTCLNKVGLLMLSCHGIAAQPHNRTTVIHFLASCMKGQVAVATAYQLQQPMCEPRTMAIHGFGKPCLTHDAPGFERITIQQVHCCRRIQAVHA
jgi:hypothetical protein